MGSFNHFSTFFGIAVSFPFWNNMTRNFRKRKPELFNGNHFNAVFYCFVIVARFVAYLHNMAVEVMILRTFTGSSRFIWQGKCAGNIIIIFVQ